MVRYFLTRRPTDSSVGLCIRRYSMKIASLVALVFAAPVLAAPPKMDYLHPAGGQRGQKVEVAAGGAFAPWPVEVWASHAGIEAAAGKRPGQFTIAIAADVPTGTHWLRFHNKDGASGLRPFLVNQIAEVVEQDPNDEPGKAQGVKELPAIVNGRLEKINDADVFSVSLKKGQTLVAAVEAYRTLRSPMDAVLQVLSADGFVLAQNDDFKEMDPLIAFEVPRDGDYLVRIFAFPSKANSRVGLYGNPDSVYRLTLTSGPFIDHAWPLAVERSRPGEVELVGWNIPSGKKVPVAAEKDVDFAFVQPKGFANGAKVRLERHPASVVGEKSVSPPVTLTGRVSDASGQKIFLDLKKGTKLGLEIDARELDFPLDPVLVLLGPDGKEIKRVQSAKLNKDPRLEFSAAKDGKHTLLVRDLHEEGGRRHVFRLRAHSAQPDFEAALSTDRFAATPGKPIEMPITISRKNGLKEEIDFSVEGLGGAVSVELVRSKDPKKSVLRMSGVKVMNRSFRLFAQVKGREETRRPVLASLGDLNVHVPHLWIGSGATK